MSDDKAAAAAPAAPGPSKGPLILALVNTLAVLGAAGTLYYTKMVFKRPAITEEGERKRLERAHEEKTITEATAPGTIDFAPVTVNIEPYPAPPQDKHPDATDDETAPTTIKGKLHYVTLGFSVEIVDGGQKAVVEEVRPIVMDKLLAILAHKPFHELTTVQGRYALRMQIIEMINPLTENSASHPPLLASEVAPPAKGKGGDHGAPAEGGGEHGAPPAPPAGEHGGGGGHGEAKAKGETHHEGPAIKALYRDGLVSNVFFTKFVVQ